MLPPMNDAGDCVFVVDDDPSARGGLARLVRTAGYAVRDFASAAEFLEAVDPRSPGCLILDARMPGLSGEELRALLESREVALHVIVVSADDDPDTRQWAQDMHATVFFRKPVDGAALLDAVRWGFRSSPGFRNASP